MSLTNIISLPTSKIDVWQLKRKSQTKVCATKFFNEKTNKPKI